MQIKLVSSKGKEQKIEFIDDIGIENEVVNLYPEIEKQRLEGFGGAITDAAGYVYAQMNQDQKNRMLDMYFSDKGLDYSLVRIPMDSCDFSTHMYSAMEDEKDIELETFSFYDTEKYIIPLLEDAQKRSNKSLKIMLSTWSPPKFMKTNNSRIGGGKLKEEYQKIWAKYFCKYIKEFQKRGYQIERVSIQNEPNAVQKWDSCVYTSEEEKNFLRDYLYPTFEEYSLYDIEIFIWDHNKERMFERAREVIDQDTDCMITGVAFHWYSGDHFEALDLVREYYPNKKLILSESCLEFSKYDRLLEEENAAKLAHDMIGNLNHGMVAFYDWNILLDENGGPNHVKNFCDAPYLFDTKEKHLIERKILKYYWHFAHFIKSGAVRIAHTVYTEKLEVTAWKNPDNTIAVIILNRTKDALTCFLRIQGKSAKIMIDSASITSGLILDMKE